MKHKTIDIALTEFDSPDELSEMERKLVDAAISASEKGYAPYSGFHVGAALLLENGQIVSGNNQENAAYPSGMCAERVALNWAGAEYPGVPVKMMAVAAKKDNTLTEEAIAPCGACRQVIAETEYRTGNAFPIILVGNKRILKFDKATLLLPLTFGPMNL